MLRADVAQVVRVVAEQRVRRGKIVATMAEPPVLARIATLGAILAGVAALGAILTRIAALGARRAIAVPAVMLAARPAFMLAAVPAIVVAAPAVAVARATSVGALAIRALAMDVAAFAVEHVVEPLALVGRHRAVGAGVRLVAVDALFAALQAIGFAPGQGAVANAIADTVLLIRLPRIDAPPRLRRCAARRQQARRQHRA